MSAVAIERTYIEGGAEPRFDKRLDLEQRRGPLMLHADGRAAIVDCKRRIGSVGGDVSGLRHLSACVLAGAGHGLSFVEADFVDAEAQVLFQALTFHRPLAWVPRRSAPAESAGARTVPRRQFRELVVPFLSLRRIDQIGHVVDIGIGKGHCHAREQWPS